MIKERSQIIKLHSKLKWEIGLLEERDMNSAEYGDSTESVSRSEIVNVLEIMQELLTVVTGVTKNMTNREG